MVLFYFTMFLGLSFLAAVATMLEDTDEIVLMESVDIPESQTDLRTSKKRPPPRGPSLVIFNQNNKRQQTHNCV